jgi:hypothetical protein
MTVRGLPANQGRPFDSKKVRRQGTPRRAFLTHQARSQFQCPIEEKTKQAVVEWILFWMT